MIYLGFALRNPFWLNRYELLKSKWIPVTQNKTIETCLFRTDCLLRFNFEWTSWRQDHSGFRVSVDLIGHRVEVVVYDNRHYRESNK